MIVVQKQLINSQIKSPQVFLIDHENNNRGLIDTYEALQLAQSVELDLVVVSQSKDTPVAKILNYGKLQYQKKKRQGQSARPTVKEVRFRPNVGAADYNLRIEQALQWLSKGDSVKFAIRLRGRENQYREQAGQMLERIVTDLSQAGKVQSLDKRSLIVQIMPA
ncbi:translation initiation factor IF-3 [Trichormus variabilis ARAD]|uniref:Translation initiation factor IF-3 n=1 Tax=Trichormus variabilis N2B TaxID=2681315 RepID=A0ABR6S809_ANAVA|nr:MULTISPECIES: translation initiation factor IF-3 [Nostocaceae]MBC1216295.1 translation initiation factor IF-3 [Trichormus variabilis ARAD]MBC1258738.1 translation initiation factor IF-3 [Trichormus variabilis V5]MBC1314445.1 translation initiation factor IF-3 [Trichormus variabilis PNB]MBC1326487.1 translation initiation factor IF-3 [Trichormus variabilis 9RC]MBD2382854.1 translation initiation factor IF-3 [Trichormus variabilis FACHB-319]QHD83137.1 translation initiation factor IF-3 [Tric